MYFSAGTECNFNPFISEPYRMNNLTSNSVVKRLCKNMQTLLTIAYLVAVAIGMLFNYKKFILFDINIFDFAGLFDFLIAPFGDFTIALFTLGTLFITLLVYQIDLFWQKKYPTSYSKFVFNVNQHKWYAGQKYTLGVLLFVLYLFLAADIYAKYYKKNILLAPNIGITYADNAQIRGILIGKTTEYIFLLQDKEVKAIPMNALIKEIKLK